ncbi:MAG: CDP-alcohol phosphatidyltransferase family protein [Deltaproteobacteria bacterium]|nr:CDP-alcohol phosphatidyltransferase family protein [Deltaproteobacteria bacterium]
MPSLAQIDIAAGLALFLFALAGATWYAFRVLRAGEVRSERVARAGTSPFLGRTPMEAAYATFEPVGRFLARIGVTANAITATGVGLAAFAGVAATAGALGLAAAFAAIAAAADALDGVVARATTGPTADGAIYDSAADRYMELLLLGGLVVHFRSSLPALVAVLGAGSGAVMVSYVSAKAEGARVMVPRGSMRRAERAVYLVAGAGLAPFAARLFPTVPFAYDAPLIAACVIIGLAAHTSAGARLIALGRAVAKSQPARVQPETAPSPSREGVARGLP